MSSSRIELATLGNSSKPFTTAFTYNPEPPTAAFSNTTRFNQEMLNTRGDDEAWLSNLATDTYETEATQKASNTTTPHWQRQYYVSHQETIDERDDEEESYY